VPSTFLIVDDDPDVLKAAATALGREAGRIDTALAPEGLAEQAQLYDAVLLDMNFAAGERDGAAGLDSLAQTAGGRSGALSGADDHVWRVALAVQALKRAPPTSS